MVDAGASVPTADVPVVQLGMDETLTGAQHHRPATRLRVLREEGVLILGRGDVVRNLHAYAWGRHPVDHYDWTVRFDAWMRERIDAGRIEDPVVRSSTSSRDPQPDPALARRAGPGPRCCPDWPWATATGSAGLTNKPPALNSPDCPGGRGGGETRSPRSSAGTTPRSPRPSRPRRASMPRSISSPGRNSGTPRRGSNGARPRNAISAPSAFVHACHGQPRTWPAPGPSTSRSRMSGSTTTTPPPTAATSPRRSVMTTAVSACDGVKGGGITFRNIVCSA